MLQSLNGISRLNGPVVRERSPSIVCSVAGIIQEPMRLTWNAALEETEMVLFESVHKLFKATGVSAQDVSHSPALSWRRPHHPFCTARKGMQQHA